MSRNVRFKRSRKRVFNKKHLIIGFVVGIIALAALSTLVVIKENNGDIMQILGGDGSKKEAEEVAPQAAQQERNFLFWGQDSSTQQLKFLWVVRVSLPAGEYTIYSPSIDDQVNYEGQYRSLVSVYQMYGGDGLSRAMETLCGITITSYIGADTEAFKQTINTLGSVTINLGQSIDYRGEDYNLILSSGKRTLKGDQLYNYLCYTNFMTADSKVSRGNVLVQILENTINPENISKTESIYSNIANLLKTNISVLDFSSSSDFVDLMFNTGVVKTVVLTEPNGFTE